MTLEQERFEFESAIASQVMRGSKLSSRFWASLDRNWYRSGPRDWTWQDPASGHFYRVLRGRATREL